MLDAAEVRALAVRKRLRFMLLLRGWRWSEYATDGSGRFRQEIGDGEVQSGMLQGGSDFG